jgi:hypothetical protein
VDRKKRPNPNDVHLCQRGLLPDLKRATTSRHVTRKDTEIIVLVGSKRLFNFRSQKGYALQLKVVSWFCERMLIRISPQRMWFGTVHLFISSFEIA